MTVKKKKHQSIKKKKKKTVSVNMIRKGKSYLIIGCYHIEEIYICAIDCIYSFLINSRFYNYNYIIEK